MIAMPIQRTLLGQLTAEGTRTDFSETSSQVSDIFLASDERRIGNEHLYQNFDGWMRHSLASSRIMKRLVMSLRHYEARNWSTSCISYATFCG